MTDNPDEATEEAITKDEMTTTVIPQHGEHDTSPAARRRSAFTELTSRKPKAAAHASPQAPSSTRPPWIFSGRDGLGAYVADPTAFPPSRVIYHTDQWVVIRDMYPKSSVHILLLPRDGTKNLLHPVDAFEDVEFLAKVQAETKKLRTLVASELRRRYGRFSAQERERPGAIEQETDGESASTPGRDWEKEVVSGIHARPSMNHLHIHILSVDRFNECMRKRPHYNSFATPFFVPLEAFPLKTDDVRRHPTCEGYLDRDLVCWRCGRNFKKRFAELKEHLKGEFEEWKRE